MTTIEFLLQLESLFDLRLEQGADQVMLCIIRTRHFSRRENGCMHDITDSRAGRAVCGIEILYPTLR